MVEKIGKVVGSVIGLILLGSIAFFVKPTTNVEQPFVGSVVQGSEYHATSTVNGETAGTYTIFEGVGTLGSVVIVSTTPTIFSIYDGDSVSSTPTTTLATFASNTAAGTYTFDVVLRQGLQLTVPTGYTGNYVITYR